MHQGHKIYETKKGSVIDCVSCGFFHADPLPTEEELETMYRDFFYSEYQPQYFASYERDYQWWMLSYDDRFDFVEPIAKNSKKRLLDIGSGPGLFLIRAQERNWRNCGIEPSLAAVQYSTKRGLDVRHEFFSEKTQYTEKFDFIHSSQVLEHVRDPLSFLKKAHSLLDQNGIICTVVPNEFNPFQMAVTENLQKNAWWVNMPEHLNYFSPESLKALHERAGFKCLKVATTFPIDIFLLFGDHYIGNDSLGRECHQKRIRFENELNRNGLNDLRRKLYDKFAELNIGREIVIYAQK